MTRFRRIRNSSLGFQDCSGAGFELLNRYRAFDSPATCDYVGRALAELLVILVFRSGEFRLRPGPGSVCSSSGSWLNDVDVQLFGNDVRDLAQQKGATR